MRAFRYIFLFTFVCLAWMLVPGIAIADNLSQHTSSLERHPMNSAPSVVSQNNRERELERQKQESGKKGDDDDDEDEDFKPQTLFLLLAEKYNPSTYRDWTDTIARHNRLRSEIVSMSKIKSRFRFRLTVVHTEDFRQRLEDNPTFRRQISDAIRFRNHTRIRSLLNGSLSQLKSRNRVLEQKANEMRRLLKLR